MAINRWIDQKKRGGGSYVHKRSSLLAQRGKTSVCSAGDPSLILGWEDPLEKEMATHSSILAWKIPWTEKPCRLQSMGSQSVEHDWVTLLYVHKIQQLKGIHYWSIILSKRTQGKRRCAKTIIPFMWISTKLRKEEENRCLWERKGVDHKGTGEYFLGLY